MPAISISTATGLLYRAIACDQDLTCLSDSEVVEVLATLISRYTRAHPDKKDEMIRRCRIILEIGDP